MKLYKITVFTSIGEKVFFAPAQDDRDAMNGLIDNFNEFHCQVEEVRTFPYYHTFEEARESL